MSRKLTSILLLFLAFQLGAQNYSFRQYGLEQGLPDKFIYSISQDASGYLWLSTSVGLCRFDGIDFDTDFPGDTLPEGIAYVSMMDSRGRQWFGFEKGEVAILENGRFRVRKPEFEANSRRINAIREDDKGRIFVLGQQNGMQIYSPELDLLFESPSPVTAQEGEEGASEEPKEMVPNPFSGLFLYDFYFLPGGEILVGSQKGLSIFSFDDRSFEFIHTGDFPDLDYMGVKVIAKCPESEQYWIGTLDEGVFVLRGSGPDPSAYSLKKLGVGGRIEYASVHSIEFDGTRSAWVNSPGEGVYRLRLDEVRGVTESLLLDEKAGMPSNYINDLCIDDDGNQWFTTQGQGITTLRDQAFTFGSIWNTGDPQNVTAVCVDGDVQWYGGDGQLALLDVSSGQPPRIFTREHGLPNDAVSALYLDQDKNLYIGTVSHGVYFKAEGSSRIMSMLRSGNSLQNRINAIDGIDDLLYVATHNGVFTYNISTSKTTIYNTFSEPPIEPLPHNRINDVMVDSKGRVWAATIYYGLPRVGFFERVDVEGKPKLELKTLMEDSRGRIWAGTYGYGVYVFDTEAGTAFNYGSEAGLKSDYCYAIAEDAKGEIWVGHRMGFSKISPETGHIQAFGRENGFTSDIRENAVEMTANGQLVFGSSEGLIFYDAYQAREDTTAPRMNFKSLKINETSFDPSEPAKLKFGRYRVRIDYAGIDLGDPEKVTYQYMLEGDDDIWSEPTEKKYVTFGKVEDGHYTFKLKACDGNGNCSVEPIELTIIVRIPFWKAWWFFLTLAGIAFLAVFTVFKIRERNQKAIQEYLQRQLDERTREVVMQKEEIELKNRDITDSLNYAQRIQASILPSIRKLHDAFEGSFVFYQPRDIVSGDFYWYERLDNDRFVVVCADSTGHGVPGAFMSMIGTTLIKDICMRPDVNKPSEVLTTLDEEVRTALNQNQEASGSNDGMDIIVAEINLRTLKFKVSSAMRPVIIYSGEEQIYIKGCRSSIGGQLDEDRVEKNFIDQEFQLKKGDIIYMFSDGYPDQFGGPLGRKFKMVRLKNLLRDIHTKDMDEQYTYIKSNFFLWKEDLEQVDDVLFMGIQI